jgi:hypothetical protein
MPIEIRTLVIKALVQQDNAGGGASAAAGAASSDNDVKPEVEMMTKVLDKINETLKQRNER